MFHFSYKALGNNSNFPLCKAFFHFSSHSKAAVLNFERLLYNMGIPGTLAEGFLEKSLHSGYTRKTVLSHGVTFLLSAGTPCFIDSTTNPVLNQLSIICLHIRQ